MHATSTTPAEAPERRATAASKEIDMRHTKPTDFTSATEAAPQAVAASVPKRRRAPSWRYSTSNLALAAGIEALRVLHVEFERRFDAHAAADVAYDASPEDAAALKALDRADSAQVRAMDRVDRAAKALLKIEVRTVDDALLKGRAYAWAMGSKDTASLPFEEDIALVLAALQRDVAKISGAPTPPPEAPPAPTGGLDAAAGEAPGRAAWDEARTAFYAAKAADKAGEVAEGDGAVFDTLEVWESIPPPTPAAMAEVMREAMQFMGLDFSFQDMDDPRTMRDFLDGGDQYEIFAIRYYLHTLRLAGIESPALAAAPIAGLYDNFSAAAFVTPHDEPGPPDAIRQAWLAHHQDARPIENRRPELVNWWRVILSDPRTAHAQSVIGAANVSAVWDSQAAAPPAQLLAAE